MRPRARHRFNRHKRQHHPQALQCQLLPLAQPLGILPAQLQPVIHETNRTHKQHGRQHNPHLRIRRMTPQHRGHSRREQNQQPAHGRRALFAQMINHRQLRVLPHNLPDFIRPQLPNHPPPQHQRKHKRRPRAHDRPKRHIPENIQRREVLGQQCQIVQHDSVNPRNEPHPATSPHTRRFRRRARRRSLQLR